MDKRIVANEVLLEEAAALMKEGREVSLTPLGNSMLPFIRGGKDVVHMRKLPQVEVGDITLVRLPGNRYVLHRVISLNGNQVTLMGDGNLVGTEQCTLDDVLGTVVAIEKDGKTILPRRGEFWRKIKPFRRYILAIYRRLPL
jgi:hypothetical protein